VYDHVLIVVEENKDYEQILDRADHAHPAPYIEELRTSGANLTQMFAEEHHSQGNYFWLFSGSNQNVGFLDQIPSGMKSTHNLGERLIASGRSFKGYSEDLETIGSQEHTSASGLYARKHVPWVSFSNLPQGTTEDTSSNLRFKDFPADFNDLPTVSFVIPNMVNDMHDGNKPASIKAGDKWLRKNLKAYRDWATDHNSLLIVTFDENDHGPSGLTNPAATDWTKRNRIVTLLVGAHVKPGDYSEGPGVTHVNLLRTLEAMYGLAKSGAQQSFALAKGITNDAILTDIFE
jgi:phospholipase C